jgi:hypothetical protein
VFLDTWINVQNVHVQRSLHVGLTHGVGEEEGADDEEGVGVSGKGDDLQRSQRLLSKHCVVRC